MITHLPLLALTFQGLVDKLVSELGTVSTALIGATVALAVCVASVNVIRLGIHALFKGGVPAGAWHHALSVPLIIAFVGGLVGGLMAMANTLGTGFAG